MRTHFTFSRAPYHGWLIVTPDELAAVGLSEADITPTATAAATSSGSREDEDAQTFLGAYKARFGREAEIIDDLRFLRPMGAFRQQPCHWEGGAMNMHAPALRRRLSDIVEGVRRQTHRHRRGALAYGRSVAELAAAACVGTAYGGPLLRDSSGPAPWAMEALSWKSAWRHIYEGPRRRDRLGRRQAPLRADAGETAGFTLAEIRERFGDYLLNPRHHILRGLAEVFCGLDPAYRSHSKGQGRRRRPAEAGDPAVGRRLWRLGHRPTPRRAERPRRVSAPAARDLAELRALLDDGEACLAGKGSGPATASRSRTVARGVRLRRFANGNGHLFFRGRPTLCDINRALAEWYGDVPPTSRTKRRRGRGPERR